MNISEAANETREIITERKSSVNSLLLAISLILLVIVAALSIAYFLQHQRVVDQVNTDDSEISESDQLADTKEADLSQFSIFIEAPDEHSLKLEVCSYPWDIEAANPAPTDIECLRFSGNGSIRKYLNNELVAELNYSNSTESAKVADIVNEINAKLISQPYLDFLTSTVEYPPAPIAGARGKSLKAHAEIVPSIQKGVTITLEYPVRYLMHQQVDKEINQDINEFFDTLLKFDILVEER